jgi:hypothetical protein
MIPLPGKDARGLPNAKGLRVKANAYEMTTVRDCMGSMRCIDMIDSVLERDAATQEKDVNVEGKGLIQRCSLVFFNAVWYCAERIPKQYVFVRER